MTCACRISNKLLGLIKNYVSNNNSLTFHEALFNTLAYQNNCKINTPTELSTIHYRTEWNIYELNLNNLYHPIKDINIHNNLRCNNNLYFDNLYNNIDYNNAKNPENLNFERYLLPSDFNFCCYRENNDMRNWPDEAIMWHWFKYGQYENRKYKD
jgi:hypothetical protein